MPRLVLADGELWYARHEGSATAHPPLLLLHGAGGSHLDWPAALRRLSGPTRLIPDLAGHGRSTAPVRRSIAAHAADMFALLDALALPVAVVVGHSMGGAVALHMALEDSRRVAGLVLIATGAHLPIAPDLWLASGGEGMATALQARMWAETAPAALRQRGLTRLAAVEPDVLRADLAACAQFDVRAALGRITAPVLVIGGTADCIVPLALSEALAKGLPNAELIAVAGGGHMLTLEQPEAVAGAILRWLRARSLAPGRLF
ncbi:MAG: alpha/beta fold hydrolase [Anaerolineae bacterium]|nr:alpha/beta fold hydrolase [Anaerolineae bacterium]